MYGRHIDSRFNVLEGIAMKVFLGFLLKLFILGFFWSTIVLAETVTFEVLPTPDLIKALQSGGHIIYMRHGPTDHSQNDKERGNLEDCSSQRNLSVQGREMVKQIGSIISALDIPLGDVRSSPYCRCKDTARLAFRQFRIEPDLEFSISKDKKESAHLGDRLRTMMMDSEIGPNNVVFVGHTSNLRDGLGIWPKPEGVVVVFQKRRNQIIYKGMIVPDAWPGL